MLVAKWIPIAILASAQFVMTLDTSVDIAPVDEVEQLAQERGASEEQAHAIAADYGDAQLEALRDSLGAVALIALLSLWFTRRLPRASTAPQAGRAMAGRAGRGGLTQGRGGRRSGQGSARSATAPIRSTSASAGPDLGAASGAGRPAA